MHDEARCRGERPHGCVHRQNASDELAQAVLSRAFDQEIHQRAAQPAPLPRVGDDDGEFAALAFVSACGNIARDPDDHLVSR